MESLFCFKQVMLFLYISVIDRTQMSNCLNCNSLLGEKVRFCSNCGAKIVARITLKGMVSEFAENVLGWDNKYFVTLKLMIVKPQLVLGEYARGVRKKYVHPFSYLIIGVTLMLFALNFFLKDYLEASQELSRKQLEWMGENIGGPYADTDFQKEQLESSKTSQEILLKYFNVLSLVLIPIYTLIAFLVYRKPYNYGEHLVFNSYIQGTSFFATFILFLISVFTSPLVYLLATFITVFLYTYAYGKLYRLSFSESLLKLLLFIGLIIIFSIVVGIVLVAAGFILGRFFDFNNHV